MTDSTLTRYTRGNVTLEIGVTRTSSDWFPQLTLAYNITLYRDDRGRGRTTLFEGTLGDLETIFTERWEAEHAEPDSLATVGPLIDCGNPNETGVPC